MERTGADIASGDHIQAFSSCLSSGEGRDRVRVRGCFKGSGGFTLLEILVAFSILAVTVTVILQLFSGNLKTLSVSQDYMEALTHADMKMREVLEMAAPSDKAWSETTPEGYRMDITVAEALGERTKNLSWRMLEIALTVSWQNNKKNRSLCVRTLKMVKREVQK